jgi:hypothetical protein
MNLKYLYTLSDDDYFSDKNGSRYTSNLFTQMDLKIIMFESIKNNYSTLEEIMDNFAEYYHNNNIAFINEYINNKQEFLEDVNFGYTYLRCQLHINENNKLYLFIHQILEICKIYFNLLQDLHNNYTSNKDLSDVTNQIFNNMPILIKLQDYHKQVDIIDQIDRRKKIKYREFNNIYLNLEKINNYHNLEELRITYLFIDNHDFICNNLKKLYITRSTINNLKLDLPNLEDLYLENTNILFDVKFSDRTKPHKLTLFDMKFNEEYSKLFPTLQKLFLFDVYGKKGLSYRLPNISNLFLGNTNIYINLEYSKNIETLSLYYMKNKNIYNKLKYLLKLNNLYIYINDNKQMKKIMLNYQIDNHTYENLYIYHYCNESEIIKQNTLKKYNPINDSGTNNLWKIYNIFLEKEINTNNTELIEFKSVEYLTN